MEAVTVLDFLSITGLRERDVLKMLSTGELPSIHGNSGEVLIDIARVSPEFLANRHAAEILSEDEVDPLVGEVVASEVLASLDEILNDALAMAANWLSDKQTGR